MSHNSVVWRFFEISAVNSSRAKCKLCSASLSRGGKVAYNTSNLRKHLEAVHHDEWKAANNENKTSAPVAQAAIARTAEPSTSIAKAFDNKRPWDFNDERSRKINRLVAEMIARDDQPFNIVSISQYLSPSCYSCGRSTNRLSVSEGGKVVSTLAADVFDFHCTYREIVTKQVNGGSRHLPAARAMHWP